MDDLLDPTVEPVKFLPERIFFHADPTVTVARPTLGLTLYLDDARAWASEHAASFFSTFLSSIDVSQLNFFTTSVLLDWRPLEPDQLDELREHLSPGGLVGRMRHMFQFSVTDDLWAPRLGFVYREVDPSRSPAQRGYIQVFLPVTTNSDDLLALAIQAAQMYPIWAGVGGYTASWNRRKPRNAFKPVYQWCKRCLGMDVQAPDAMSHRVIDGLPGASWLTIVGNAARDRWEMDIGALQNRTWRREVAVMPLTAATLIRAGSRPEAGDVNKLDYPEALSEAAQALEPYLVKEPPELPGEFGEGECTDAWMRRFSFPEQWT